MTKFSFSLFLSLLATSSGIQAATYYIDFDTGVDSNHGTSTGTPWKLHPWMTGEAVSYSNNPGDKFVFKGGVIWTNCWPLAVPATSGTLANSYQLVSETNWPATNWTRSIFMGSGGSGTSGVPQTIISFSASVSNYWLTC